MTGGSGFGRTPSFPPRPSRLHGDIVQYSVTVARCHGRGGLGNRHPPCHGAQGADGASSRSRSHCRRCRPLGLQVERRGSCCRQPRCRWRPGKLSSVSKRSVVLDQLELPGQASAGSQPSSKAEKACLLLTKPLPLLHCRGNCCTWRCCPCLLPAEKCKPSQGVPSRGNCSTRAVMPSPCPCPFPNASRSWFSYGSATPSGVSHGSGAPCQGS